MKSEKQDMSQRRVNINQVMWEAQWRPVSRCLSLADEARLAHGRHAWDASAGVFDRAECGWALGRVVRVVVSWNSHHLRRMFSIPPALFPCSSSGRRSSEAHQSLTRGRSLAAGGLQWLLKCSGLLVWSHVWPICRVSQLPFKSNYKINPNLQEVNYSLTVISTWTQIQSSYAGT